MQFRRFLGWGLVGGLLFLVLLQGYELIREVRVSYWVKFSGAILVTVVVSVLARWIHRQEVVNGRA